MIFMKNGSIITDQFATLIYVLQFCSNCSTKKRTLEIFEMQFPGRPYFLSYDETKTSKKGFQRF